MFGPHAAKRKIDFAIIKKQFSSNGKIRYDTIYVNNSMTYHLFVN
jgi:hypothetical protein